MNNFKKISSMITVGTIGAVAVLPSQQSYAIEKQTVETVDSIDNITIDSNKLSKPINSLIYWDDDTVVQPIGQLANNQNRFHQTNNNKLLIIDDTQVGDEFIIKNVVHKGNQKYHLRIKITRANIDNAKGRDTGIGYGTADKVENHRTIRTFFNGSEIAYNIKVVDDSGNTVNGITTGAYFTDLDNGELLKEDFSNIKTLVSNKKNFKINDNNVVEASNEQYDINSNPDISAYLGIGEISSNGVNIVYNTNHSLGADLHLFGKFANIEKVVTENKITKEKIDFETKYENDDTLEIGKEKIKQDGVVGEKTITTKDGKVIDEKITIPPKPKIILKGTKKVEDKIINDVKTKVEDIPFETKYEDDNTLEIGKEKIKQDGIVGKKEITTTQKIVNGKPQGQPTVTSKILNDKKDKIILKGTKKVEDKVTEDVQTRSEDIPFETKYENDNTLEIGKEKVKQEGIVGKKEIKTIQKIVNGKPQGQPVVTSKIMVDKKDKIIIKGTKDVITEDVKIKSEDIPFETIYEIDDTLEVGQEKIKQDGIVGKKEITTTQKIVNNKPQGQPVVTSKIMVDKKDKIIVKGGKKVLPNTDSATNSFATFSISSLMALAITKKQL